MPNGLPFDLLRPLASETEQVRYIEHATTDEYLIPSELLNDAWHFCERAILFAERLSADQRAAVDSLQDSIRNAPSGLEDEPRIVENPAWVAIRQKALATLDAFGQPLPS